MQAFSAIFLFFLYSQSVYADDLSRWSLYFGIGPSMLQSNKDVHNRPMVGFFSAVKYNFNEFLDLRMDSISQLGYSSFHGFEIYSSSIDSKMFYTTTSFGVQCLFNLKENRFYSILGIGIGMTTLVMKDATITGGMAQAYHKLTSSGWGYDIGLGYKFKENFLIELIYQELRNSYSQVIGGPYNKVTHLHTEISSHPLKQRIYVLSFILKVL